MRRLTLLTNPDTCNLHCPLCFLNQRGVSSGFGEMPIEVARRSIEKYAGVREVIPSTMGEPLLYSHFEELLELCGSLGIPMNLTTNGSFPRTWGSDEGLKSLLLACSDIKVSTLNSICNLHPNILAYLEAPIGSAYGWNGKEWVKE